MKRGTVMLIQRGDPEITGAIVEGIAEDYKILITKARGDYQRLIKPAGPIRRFARRALGLYGLVVYSVATMGRG